MNDGQTLLALLVALVTAVITVGGNIFVKWMELRAARKSGLPNRPKRKRPRKKSVLMARRRIGF
jgi:hypothetical protein